MIKSPQDLSDSTKLLRLGYNETQKKFAKRIGVSVSTVSRYERGVVKNVDRIRKVTNQKIIRREQYFKYESKQGYQLEFKDKENISHWTKRRNYDELHMLHSDIEKFYPGVRVIRMRRIRLIHKAEKKKREKKQ